MKNIHVLPTDKPSRVYLIKSNNKLGITSNNPEFTENFGIGTQNQNIYITSNEEITVNDYITDGYLVWKWKDDSSLLGRKKVILTTDQDLIGVQAIDDDFLEWFLAKANDSGKPIDIVEVEKYHWFYIIMIPKEEPKQETLEEILEEDLKFPIIIENGMDYLNLTTKIFNNGAKWQQEQIGKSEFLQKLRGTLSDAEARRLIFETFKTK